MIKYLFFSFILFLFFVLVVWDLIFNKSGDLSERGCVFLF